MPYLQSDAEAQVPRELGSVEVDVSDIVGRPYRTWVRFIDSAGERSPLHEFPEGRGSTPIAAGRYQAHVYVEHAGAPFLVEIETLEVTESQTSYLLASIVEGSGDKPLSEFDRDHDLAIDRVELLAGTDPDDPLDMPGYDRLEWQSPVLDPDSAWYLGDLQTFSEHSIGDDSVERLVRKAERAGLDFLAITDRNTLASAFDPEFESRKVVLIPALEWGTPERGYALIYKPGYRLEAPGDVVWAQGIADRVVQQGGVYAVAHPGLRSSSWQWKTAYFNAVQVWCMSWRRLLPVSLELVDEELKTKRDGEFVYPIARIAQSPVRSGNGMAELFWEQHLDAGRPSAAIAGSHYAERNDPFGEPLTWVYAKEKSMDAIVRGIRAGRTILSRDKDAPRVDFMADVFNDGSVDVRIGGVVPLRHPVRFIVTVRNAKEKRLEVLLNDELIRSAVIHTDELQYEFMDEPTRYSHYRIRITEIGDPEDGYGIEDLLVMTGPIFAREMVFVDEKTGRSSGFKVEADTNQRDEFSTTGSLPEDPEAVNPR